MPLCVSTHKGICLRRGLGLTHTFKLLVALYAVKMYKVTYQNYFNKPSTRNSNTSTVIQIALERNSVTLKSHSVLFFLMLLRGSCDVFVNSQQRCLALQSGLVLLQGVSTVKLVTYQ